MKGLLVYRINKDDVENSGVIKKCIAQFQAFKKNGFDVDILWLGNDGVHLNSSLIYPKSLKPKSLNLYKFYLNQFGRILKKQVFKTEYDFVYLRHPFFDPLLSRSLNKIKKKFPEILQILEINTYPYDAEPKRSLHKFSLKLDQILRKKAYRYIDRIVHYGQEKSIWEIPTINIGNGIDLEGIPVVQKNSERGKIHLLGVGNWSYWHGLDRIVKGMELYRGKEEIEIKLVGSIDSSLGLEHSILKSGLSDKIKLIPATRDDELNQLFETADIGIGTLGIHRKNVSLDYSLKHREYCARGLPFILSGNDPDFDGRDFVFKIIADDRPIDLESVVAFYKKLNVENTRKEMRSYAEKNLTWENRLKPVFDFLRD